MSLVECGGSSWNGDCDHAACGWVDCRVCLGSGVRWEDAPAVECGVCQGHGSVPAEPPVASVAVLPVRVHPVFGNVGRRSEGVR